MRTMRRAYRRRPIMRGRRKTLKRQAFGNFASAMQQRDSTNVVISTEENVTIEVPKYADEGTIVRNCNAILCRTEYFQNYLGMYDQYKINAIRASCEMTYCGNLLMNASTFPSICTSWDRNGIKINTVQTGENLYNYTLPDYSTVCSYSSANEKTLYYGARWGVIRQLDAASMMEKSMYLPTSNTREVLSMGNMYSAWNPMLLISMKSPAALTAGSNYCTISIHWQFDVTLRGLRKVPTVDMSKYKPYGGFVGYQRNNYGFAILKPGTAPGTPANYVVVGKNVPGGDSPTDDPTSGNNYEPSINPCWDGSTAGTSDTGLVVPNNGLPSNNINI